MKNEPIGDRLPPCGRQQSADRRNSPPPKPRQQGYYRNNQSYQSEYNDFAPQEMTFLQRLIATSVIIAFTIFAKWVYMRMGK